MNLRELIRRVLHLRSVTLRRPTARVIIRHRDRNIISIKHRSVNNVSVKARVFVEGPRRQRNILSRVIRSYRGQASHRYLSVRCKIILIRVPHFLCMVKTSVTKEGVTFIRSRANEFIIFT